jgi:hypothetical protein
VFGTGSLGPTIVTAIGLTLLVAALSRRIRQGASMVAP